MTKTKQIIIGENRIYFYTVMMLIFSLAILAGCNSGKNSRQDQGKAPKRFFSDASFWNQPLPENAEIDPRSDAWIKLLKREPTLDHFDFNNTSWTVPVYEVDSLTPTYDIKLHYLDEAEKKYRLTKRDHYGHGPGFGKDVPIPENAMPDPKKDAHLALVDWGRMLAWDMWGLKKLPDGSWESKTGMKYKLDGDGIFHTEDYKGILDDESVHFHGPSRASGVPAIAGLIMYDEVKAGEIRHKLAFASRFAAFQEFVFPASWTDGWVKGGIPEGAVLQLDPDLDLSQFDLLPGEVVVARALQKYGMVLVDVAAGQSIYAEGLWGHPDESWDGLLPEGSKGLKAIKFDYYRVIKVENVVKNKGDVSNRQRSSICRNEYDLCTSVR